jgi:hypothetical protein
LSEWWTYRPADFLMFAPRIYWRLFESINAQWWPLALVATVGAVVWLVVVTVAPAARRDAPSLPTAIDAADAGINQGRGHRALSVAAAAGALAFAFTAWAFLLERLAPIHWVARGYAVGFGVLALVALALAWRGKACLHPRGSLRWTVGVALAGLGVAYPLLAGLAGRPWAQGEWLFLTPDPTVVTALGALTMSRPTDALTRSLHAVGWFGCLAWCAITSATLATMGSSLAIVPLAAALLSGTTVLRARASRAPR